MRILIADDDQLIRESLQMMLDAFDDIEVVKTVSNGIDVMDFLRDNSVYLLLLDIRMPLMDGVEVTRCLKEEGIDVKILILTTFTDHDYIYHAIQNGASGYILKSRGIKQIYQAIKSIEAGQVVLDTTMATTLLSATPYKKIDQAIDLTEKEYAILKCIGNGLNNKEISKTLFLSEGTIRNYISQLLLKLSLRDRTQLAIYYVKYCEEAE